MSKQVVYHGSYCKIEHPQLIEGKYSKDFGKGFYCTILEEQAEKWAKKYNTPTHQIALCTDEALKCLKFIESEEI